MSGAKEKKSKEKLATALSKQIGGVNFSNAGEINKLENAKALKNNYLQNLLRLGWAITNRTSEMKTAYNWHGLDKYRFVPIGKEPPEDFTVAYKGLLASVKEEFVRRAIKRRLKSEISNEVNDTAAKKRDANINDEETDGTTAVALYNCRLGIIKAFNAWETAEDDNILNLTMSSSMLWELTKNTNTKRKKSLLEHIQDALEKLDEKWKAYCGQLEKQQKSLREKKDSKIF